MKTTFTLLILILSFSYGSAQNIETTTKAETTKTISVVNEDENFTATVATETNTVKENEAVMIDADTLRASVARAASDIRIYLNRERKVANIDLLFPKINKAVKA